MKSKYALALEAIWQTGKCLRPLRPCRWHEKKRLVGEQIKFDYS